MFNNLDQLLEAGKCNKQERWIYFSGTLCIDGVPLFVALLCNYEGGSERQRAGYNRKNYTFTSPFTSKVNKKKEVERRKRREKRGGRKEPRIESTEGRRAM